jgi:threonine/homoserine/homoserine lactone efflux protein
MVDTAVLLAFLPFALALNLTPGPDMLFCLGQGLSAGPRAALAGALGVTAGGMVHAAAAGLGLAALLAAWPAAFEAIRWAGVAFLLWVAWRTLRSGPAKSAAPIRPARAFRDGLACNLTNPKVALFMLAFLPQFVTPAAPVLPQFLLLGAVIAAGGLVVNGAVGAFAGGIGRRLAGAPALARAMRWATATLFAGLALRLALERRA